MNESDTGNLVVGEPAQFTVSAYGQRIFRGTVSAITPNGQTVSNVVTYPVTIDVDKRSLNGATLFPWHDGQRHNYCCSAFQCPACSGQCREFCANGEQPDKWYSQHIVSKIR